MQIPSPQYIVNEECLNYACCVWHNASTQDMVGFIIIIIINAYSKSPGPPDLFLEEITKRHHPTGAQGSLPLREASFEILD